MCERSSLGGGAEADTLCRMTGESCNWGNHCDWWHSETEGCPKEGREWNDRLQKFAAMMSLTVGRLGSSLMYALDTVNISEFPMFRNQNLWKSKFETRNLNCRIMHER